MAINKTINKSSKSHGAMRNCIEYVLKEQKIKDGLVYMTGPAPEQITWDSVYQSFLEEKRLWRKDFGRMYNHNIISLHKDENISSSQALEFGKEFTEKWFPNHQTLISVHQDRDHIHIHLVTNTVSYVDGKKLHNSREDLKSMKTLTNRMCLEKGLSLTVKGRHFDGSPMEKGETIAWSKDKYQLLTNEKRKSFVVDCAVALLETVPRSASRQEFIQKMKDLGWTVHWEDRRKHIVFQNENGDKVRDSNLEKTFSMDVNKEVLTNEFARQNQLRLAGIKAERASERKRKQQIEQYYREINAAIAGTGASGETINSVEETLSGERPAPDGRETGGSTGDTTAFIRELRAEITDNRIKNRALRHADAQSNIKEQQSIAGAEQRRIEEQFRLDAAERAGRVKRPVIRRRGPQL